MNELDCNTESGFKTEFSSFCSLLLENFLENGRRNEIMTSDVEKKLLTYLLSQETSQCSEDLSTWLQLYVFCVVSDEEQTQYELHILEEDQKQVISIENYYQILSALYAQFGRITLESFEEKVKESYALIPEEVVKYFFNYCSDRKDAVKSNLYLQQKLENKENNIHGCKIINYDYVKKKITKRKIVTELFNKSNGNLIKSKSVEEDLKEGFVYCIEKSEKLIDITNNQRTEISSTNFTSSQPLEVKFLNQSVLAYFPPDEMQNRDHLVTLSELILSDNGISPEKSPTIQIEFVVLPTTRDKSVRDIFLNVDNFLNQNQNPRKKTNKPTMWKKSSITCLKTIDDNVSSKDTNLSTVDLSSQVEAKDNLENSATDVESSLALSVEAYIDDDTGYECFDDDTDEECPVSVVFNSKEMKHEQTTENIADGIHNEKLNNVTVEVLPDEINGLSSGLVNDKMNKENIVFEVLDDASCSEIQTLIDDSPEIVEISGSLNGINRVVEEVHKSGPVNDTDKEGSKTYLLLEANKTANVAEETFKMVKGNVKNYATTKIRRLTKHKPDKSKTKLVPYKRSFSIRQGIYHCSFCDTQFNTRKEMLDHDINCAKKSSIGSYLCRYCNAILQTKGEVIYHQNTCSQNPNEHFSCKFCHRTFHMKSALLRHFKDCKLNPKRFTKKIRLKMNKKNESLENKSQIAKNQPTKDTPAKAKPRDITYLRTYTIKKGIYCCSFCDANFKTRDKILDHKMKCANKPSHHCKYCNAVLETKNKARYHKDACSQNPNGPFSCKFCEKTFSTKATMLSHSYCCALNPKRTDLTKKKEFCEICGKFFTSKGLKEHIQRMHSENPTMFTCHICGHATKSRQALNSHIRAHDRRNVYKCNDCVSEYKTAISLKDHINKVHSGNKPYKCSHCESCFGSRARRRNHIIKEHMAKQYKCDICGKEFRWKKNFEGHKTTHSDSKPYTCNICGKGFKWSNSVILHQKTVHEGTKWFCPICGLPCSQKSNLNRHIASHKKQVPPNGYECDLCDKVCARLVNLKGHRKIHFK